MVKRICASLVTVMFILGIAVLAGPVGQASAEEAINAGNKICPVSGEKINEKTKATYEYEGKIYNFCCPMCIDSFKKEPQKYIEKVEEELQAGSEGSSGHEGHGASHHGMH
ncbi:MAG: YHS domain-containing protein [Candidatus Omnitrophota bacterium]|nr:YHS domain-containing protein [Candidatus Omnitrophota bacterium]